MKKGCRSGVQFVEVERQPDDVTCGPTCLHAIYRFYGDSISLSKVISEVEYLKNGGTLAVLLGLHAIKRGYEVTINVLDMEIFDPTWFKEKANLIEKLKEQMRHKRSQKLHQASEAYIDFIERGGRVISNNVSSQFLKKSFEAYGPILSGLSATYLYGCSREYTNDLNQTVYDDICGYPCGHFVVLNGYCPNSNKIAVSDPYAKNPFSNLHYEVRISRLINAILLGELTYDANLLFIQPKK